MKNKETQMWIPLYVDKWIFGSTRIELDPAERGVFVDLLALGAKDNGYIRANENTPYLLPQLAGLLNVSVELLQSTIQKCIQVGKIDEPQPGIYHITNWDKYQFSERHKRRLKNKQNLNDVRKNGHNVRKRGHYNIIKDNIIQDNIKQNNKINNITPPKNNNNIPPLKGGDCQIVDNSVDNVDNSKQEKENIFNSDKQDNSNFHLNEREWASDEVLGAGSCDKGAIEKGLKNENKVDNKVNWDNCKNDNQRLMAFWVQLDHPELYKNATKEQAQEFFKRFTRDSSSILKMAGDLEIAKEAVKACREWLRSKKLEYNLTTIARNIGKFLNDAIRLYSLPPETDLFLLEEYRKLYKELKGEDIQQLELVKLIKQRMKETSKSVNEILEEGIRKVKQKLNSDIPNEQVRDLIKSVAQKITIKQEVNYEKQN
jgi:hypothetical protein